MKEAKKPRNGTVLLEVKSKSQADRALSTSVWVDQEVVITAHGSLNTSRGIVRCREFRDCDEAEVLNALSGQSVIAVNRFNVRRNGKTEAITTFVLTSDLPTISSAVKAAYMEFLVEMYFPNSLRCYQCQIFGHGKSTCNRKQVCAICAQEGLMDSDCTNAPHCANCAGIHPAYLRECVEWQKQQEITRVKFTRNVSFGEAKRIVSQLQSLSTASPSNGKSYAQATQINPSPLHSVSQQQHQQNTLKSLNL